MASTTTWIDGRVRDEAFEGREDSPRFVEVFDEGTYYHRELRPGETLKAALADFASGYDFNGSTESCEATATLWVGPGEWTDEQSITLDPLAD